MAFQVGYNKSVVWSSTPGVNTLNVTEHSWSEMVDKLDVTHTGTNGFQALLAGILRGDGNVKANCDDAVVVTDPTTVNVISGATGKLSFYYYSAIANPFVVPATILRVNHKSVVNGVASFDFDISFNILVATYKRPTQN